MTDNELLKWCLDYIEDFHAGCFDDDETDRIIDALRQRVENPKRPMTPLELRAAGKDHERVCRGPDNVTIATSYMWGIRFAEKRLGVVNE